MANIPDYTQQVAPQGSIQAQASPVDFGAGIAQAGQQLGQSINAVGQSVFRVSENQGRIQAATDIEKVRYGAQQWYQQQKSQLDPLNDPNYSDKLQGLSGQFQNYMDQTKQQYMQANQNPAYMRMFNAHMSNLTWSMQRGVNNDIAQSAGEALGVKLQDLGNSSLDALRQDPSEDNLNRVLQKYKDAVGNIDLPGFEDKHKIEMYSKFQSQAAQTYYRSLAASDPDGMYQALGMSGAANGKNGPHGGTYTQNPGTAVQAPDGGFGTPNIPAQAAQYSGVAASYGKTAGVDPNFLLAQMNAEHAGATGVAPDVQNQANRMGGLLKTFGGDYYKAAAAYNWGAPQVQAAVDKYGENWAQHAPTETQFYLNKIFSSLPQKPNGSQTPNAGPQPPRELTDSEIASATPQSPDTLSGQLWSQLTDPQRVEVGRLAEQGVRANQIAQQQNVAMLEKAQKQQQEQQYNGFVSKLIDGNLTVSDIRNDSILTGQQREHFYNAISADNTGSDKTDPNVFNTLFRRIHASDTDPNKITSFDQIMPYLGHGVTASDVGKLNKELSDNGQPDAKQLAEFKNMAHKLISGDSLMTKDPQGEQMYYNWNARVDSIIKENQNNGISLHQMLDPTNKSYLGPTVNQFTRDSKAQMQSMTDRMKGAPMVKTLPPEMTRNPGETIDQWRTRTRQ